MRTYTKSLERSQLSDSHLEDSLHVAATTFEPSTGSVARVGAIATPTPILANYYKQKRGKNLLSTSRESIFCDFKDFKKFRFMCILCEPK